MGHIQLFRSTQDRKIMPRVEEMCRLLTERELQRGGRRLVFELIDPPPRVRRIRTRGSADDFI